MELRVLLPLAFTIKSKASWNLGNQENPKATQIKFEYSFINPLNNVK